MGTLNAQQQQALTQLLLTLDEATKMVAAAPAVPTPSGPPNDGATTQAPQASADAQVSAHPVNGASA